MTAPAWVQEANANYQAMREAVQDLRSFLENASGEGEGQPGDVAFRPILARQELGDALGLTDFEQAILLLCAATELDPQIARLLTALQGDSSRTSPTFGLALELLPGPHWSAVTPVSPLRLWGLIEVGVGESLIASPLRIDERTLHHLCGVDYLDSRLRGLVEPVDLPEALPESYRHHAQHIAQSWSEEVSPTPLIQIEADLHTARGIVAAAGAHLGTSLYVLPAARLPVSAGEIVTISRIWEREALFSRHVLLIEDIDVVDRPTQRAAFDLAMNVAGLVAVVGHVPASTDSRPVHRVVVESLAPGEQRALWQHALGRAGIGLNGELDGLAAQFPLDPAAILAIGTAVAGSARPSEVVSTLWQRCRAEARVPLSQLADRVDSRVTWDDLVLPDDQMRTLLEIATHVRQRTRVYHTWGFADRGGRGLGISALFAGPSGTGKTLAAEVLANDLQLDLFRIDLSQVVSKYIGETEKNLRVLFDAAERSGAILLFDEADALFGRRSEVKDSHDRYANIEVSYLLQRMESYRGLAILTSNQQAALDGAFLRRLRFIVQFPFPDAASRSRIWQRSFPETMPREKLDYSQLARLAVAGGNIRNIAMHAAFLAADGGGSVTMGHLLQAAMGECRKIDKHVTAAEIGGWA